MEPHLYYTIPAMTTRFESKTVDDILSLTHLWSYYNSKGSLFRYCNETKNKFSGGNSNGSVKKMITCTTDKAKMKDFGSGRVLLKNIIFITTSLV